MKDSKEYALKVLKELQDKFGKENFKYEYCGIERFHYIVVLSKAVYDNDEFIAYTWEAHVYAQKNSVGFNWGVALGMSSERRD